MNRERFSRISHTGIRFWNPLDEDQLLRTLAGLPLDPGARVLDYGCGDGELLVELARQTEITITAVDPSAAAIDVCRKKLHGRFHCKAFDPADFDPQSFDLIINIGASPGFSVLIQQICPLLAAGGRILIGDGHWDRKPDPAYLEFLGAQEDDMLTHDQNLRMLADAGFELELSVLSKLEAWDCYEDRYDANMRAFLSENPQDEEFTAYEERRSRWRAMYLKHGRGTMGFGLYQARMP
ncbi:MAG: SAM-dependent methyltransferase [Planctomycetota bacterium]|jgi:SAM-dependent methyltransferase